MGFKNIGQLFFRCGMEAKLLTGRKIGRLARVDLSVYGETGYIMFERKIFFLGYDREPFVSDVIDRGNEECGTRIDK